MCCLRLRQQHPPAHKAASLALGVAGGQLCGEPTSLWEAPGRGGPASCPEKASTNSRIQMHPGDGKGGGHLLKGPGEGGSHEMREGPCPWASQDCTVPEVAKVETSRGGSGTWSPSGASVSLTVVQWSTFPSHSGERTPERHIRGAPSSTCPVAPTAFLAPSGPASGRSLEGPWGLLLISGCPWQGPLGDMGHHLHPHSPLQAQLP